jgi:hypothetical protein
MTSDSLYLINEIDCFGRKDSIEQIILSSDDYGFQTRLNDVNNVFERIQMEMLYGSDNLRLDSIKFKAELYGETATLGLVQPNNWGICDCTRDK